MKSSATILVRRVLARTRAFARSSAGESGTIVRVKLRRLAATGVTRTAVTTVATLATIVRATAVSTAVAAAVTMATALPASVAAQATDHESAGHTIAVIGTGDMGRTLGAGWHEAGHEVLFAVRNPESPNAQKAKAMTRGEVPLLPVAEAVAKAEIVLLVTQFRDAPAALAGAGDLTGKILIDATNPLAPGLAGLTVGFTDSAGEQIARWHPEARVVKAFNSTGYNIQADPEFEAGRAVMFVAGDDEEAKAVVLDLAAALGMEPVDAGGLDAARLLEPLAMLWIRLAYKEGLGRDFALILERR